jgi:hypothetical protein
MYLLEDFEGLQKEYQTIEDNLEGIAPVLNSCVTVVGTFEVEQHLNLHPFIV